MHHAMLAVVWLAIISIAFTSATNTVTFNPNYRVRGVASRTRYERALNKAEKKSVKHTKRFKQRSYASDFVGVGSADEEDDGAGRSGGCDGARSGASKNKFAKARSGSRSGGKVKGRSRASGRSGTGRSGKRAKGGTGARSGECASTKLKSGRQKSGASAKAANFDGREYPPDFVTTGAEASKKGIKGEQGPSILGASAVGCARDGSQSASKKGKGRTRTRGLKKSKKGIGSSSGRSEACVEGASFKSGSGSAKFTAAKSNSAKSTKFKATSGVVEPARTYPEPGYTSEQAAGVKDPKGYREPKGNAPKVSSGVAAPGQEEPAALAARSTASCEDIADGVIPSGENLAQQYEVSADMAVDTTNTTIEQFFDDFRQYLQKEVALDVAGCNSPADAVPTKVTGVVVQQPYDTRLGCQVTGTLQSQPTDALDLAGEQQTTIPKKSARQATTGKFVQTGPGTTEEYPQEYPTETYPEETNPTELYEQPGSLSTSTLLGGAATENETPSQLTEGDAFVVTTNEDNGCYHIVVVVDVYLTPDAEKQDTDMAKVALQNAISKANMDTILGIANSDVTRKFSTTTTSAFMATDTNSGEKIGFSMGMFGIILISLAALKVAFSRKQRAKARKAKALAGMSDESLHYNHELEDDSTFVYPTEDELLGPEFGDLAFDEAYQSHQKEQFFGNEEPKSSAYILDDLQEGISVEAGGSSYGSNKQGRRPKASFRTVAPTPDYRKGCC